VIKIRNLDELRGLDPCYVWAWIDAGYSVWRWDEGGFIEQAPTDMSMYYRRHRVPDDMFPMYLIPEPPPREAVDAVPLYTVLYQGEAIEK